MKLIKLTFLMFAGLFLVACGGGSSGSSSGFAPANAAAFETKFVNQIIISSSTVSTILPNRMLSQTNGNAIVTIAYVYTNTGANTATLSNTDLGVTCTATVIFTSALAGTFAETCTDGTSASGTFTFGGSN